MSELFENTPEINFIEGISLEDTKNGMINDYLEEYKNITGIETVLYDADPYKLILNACALRIYQAFMYIDKSGKMDLLKYSYGDYIDNLGVLKNVTRLAAASATTTIRFTLSAARASVAAIPKGTRVTGAMNLYFETTEYAEIPIGSLYVDVEAECLTIGEFGNGYAAGQINTLVDISSCPYIQSAINITESSGGRDLENDDHYKENIALAPATYSVAGPEDAYKAHVKAFDSSIGDVRVDSTSPGVVSIKFLLSDGTIPNDNLIAQLTEYISAKDKRPMCDNLVISAPTEVTYDIVLTYYINKSNANKAVTIQTAVDSAVNQYINWQRSIGKDINPDKLMALIVSAGAKRATITSPVYTAMGKTTVASFRTKSITYGGLEDD